MKKSKKQKMYQKLCDYLDRAIETLEGFASDSSDLNKYRKVLRDAEQYYNG